MPSPSTLSCLYEPSILPQKLLEHPGGHSVPHPSSYCSCPTCDKPLHHLSTSAPCDGVRLLYSTEGSCPLLPSVLSPGPRIPACAFRGTQLSPNPAKLPTDPKGRLPYFPFLSSRGYKKLLNTGDPDLRPQSSGQLRPRRPPLAELCRPQGTAASMPPLCTDVSVHVATPWCTLDGGSLV